MPQPETWKPNPLTIVLQSFTDRDYETGMNAITEDCEVVEVPTGESWKGRAGLRQEFDRWGAAFADGGTDFLNVIECGDWVIVEATWRGTHDGDLVFPDRTVAATGNKLAFPYATVGRIENDRLVHAKHYYDLRTVLHQLSAQ
jgi:ketosteroid isomerase-like protein